MEKKPKSWTNIAFIAGVVAIIAGAIDPLEGSVLIGAGSATLAISSHFAADRHRRFFLYSSLMILIGIGFLFYFSSLGGFGGPGNISWWWGVFILPYPLGWLAVVAVLIYRAARKPNRAEVQKPLT